MRSRSSTPTSRATGPPAHTSRPALAAATRMASVSLPSSGVLALPIALAGLGPLAGVGVVVAVAAAKLVTMSALLDAAERTTSYRLRGSGPAGVARQLLGRSGAAALVSSSALYKVLSLLGALVALAGIANDLLGVGLLAVPPLMAAVVAADFAGRQQVNTRATTVVLLVVCVGVVAVALAGWADLDAERLRGLGGWGPAILGAVLTSFVGEAYLLDVVRASDDVRVRTASRRGAMAGVALVALVISAWVAVVSAVLPPAALIGAEGSVASAAEGNAVVAVVALITVLCVLVAANNVLRNVPSLGLQVLEWLPRPARREETLRLGVDRLAVTGREGEVLGVTVLSRRGPSVEVWLERQLPSGLVTGGASLGASGQVERIDPAVAGAEPTLVALGLMVVGPHRSGLTVSVRSPRSRPVRVQERPSALRVATAVLDEGAAAAVSRWLLRHPGSTLEQLAKGADLPIAVISEHLEALARDGALDQRQEDGAASYRLRLGSRSRAGATAHVQTTLDALAGEGASSDLTAGPSVPPADPQTRKRPKVSHMLERGGVALTVTLLPGVTISLLAVVLLAREGVNLADLYAVSGVLTVTVFGGALPLLLVAAARRRGDLPGLGHDGFLGLSVVRGAVMAACVMTVALHALVWWTAPLARLAAGATLVGLALLVVRSWTEGRLRPGSAVVVLDDRAQGTVQVTSVHGGRPWPLAIDTALKAARCASGAPHAPAAAEALYALEEGAPRLTLAAPAGGFGPEVTVTALRRLHDGTITPLGVTVISGEHRFDAALLEGRMAVPTREATHLHIQPADLNE